MPAFPLSDREIADVLTYVVNSWSNGGGGFTPEEIAEVRQETSTETSAALRDADEYAPLPHAPTGWKIEEAIRLDMPIVRMASNGLGNELFLLEQNGAVYRLDLATKALEKIIDTDDYNESDKAQFSTLGLTRDPTGRLWITSNAHRSGSDYARNEVAIWRTSAFDGRGVPIKPKRWFKAEYPYGIGPYTHGVSEIRFGPDGLLYVSSGSRTDSGEPGNGVGASRLGETDLTACIWRLDPTATMPSVQVIARGIRNAYSFCWDGAGNLFSVSNGPTADGPEEMDAIVPPQDGGVPRHHGFPYQYGGDPASHRWYDHTPIAPPGTNFVLPVLNHGPDGLDFKGGSTSTFTPHSSPAGMVWLGPEWPSPYANTMLIGRFGGLVKTAEGSGFDVLALRMHLEEDGRWSAHASTFLAPVARPIDLHLAGGSIYIAEYSRSARQDAGFRPGRILRLSLSSGSAAK